MKTRLIKNPHTNLLTILLSISLAASLAWRKAEAAETVRYYEAQTLYGGDATDAFATSVAIDGDTVVVGDPNYKVGQKQFQGSAFVYVKRNGVWEKQQQLLANDGIENDIFGYSVAISGNTIVVGAVRYFSNDNRAGAAYVFVRTGTTWTQQQRLAAAAGAPLNYFGYSVSIEGNRIAVGAFQELIGPGTGLLRRRGAVYLYTRTGTNWSPETTLTAENGQHGDAFGCSVSLYGDAIAIGAYLADGPNPDQGAAFIFERISGVWTQRARFSSDDGMAGDHFGRSVALSFETVLVGAPQKANGANTEQGAAYVFNPRYNKNTLLGWFQQKKLFLTDGRKGDQLGACVALFDGIAVVGVGTHEKGAAYLWVCDGVDWSLQQTILPSFNAIDNHFGWSVGLKGEDLVVGAINQRSIYLYRQTKKPPVATVSAASYLPSIANESIAALFGDGLATTTEFAAGTPLPTSLGGTTVMIKDQTGTSRPAPLFFVSPKQINLQIPAGVAEGDLTLIVTAGDGVFSGGNTLVSLVAPSLFTANSLGNGPASALALRVKPGGVQSIEPVAHFDAGLNRFVADPIDLGPEGEQVFLILFGTGLRRFGALSNVTTSIGGQPCETMFVGPAPGFIGLDQANVFLPRSLAGRGELDLLLSINGKQSNPVRMNFK